MANSKKRQHEKQPIKTSTSSLLQLVDQEGTLREISLLPEVSGCCIIQKDNKVILKEHPGFPDELLLKAGIQLVRLIQLGATTGLDIQAMQFGFDRYSLIGISFSENSVLIIFCRPRANHCLIATTASILVTDIQNKSIFSRKSHLPLKAVASDEEKKLKPLLQCIERDLAETIGPIAMVIMQQSLKKLRENGAVTARSLPELIKIMHQEIDNPDLADEFTDKMRKILAA
jgi:hypothetical protein